MIFLLLFNHWVMSDSLVTPWTVAHQTPVHGIFPGKNTGVGCHFLLQGIFLTQGPYLHLLHYRWILYWLSHQGNPTSKTWKSCIKAILTIAFRNYVINLFCNKKQEEKHFIPCPVKSLARCSPITVVFYAFQWIPVIRGGKKKTIDVRISALSCMESMGPVSLILDGSHFISLLVVNSTLSIFFVMHPAQSLNIRNSGTWFFPLK